MLGRGNALLSLFLQTQTDTRWRWWCWSCPTPAADRPWPGSVWVQRTVKAECGGSGPTTGAVRQGKSGTSLGPDWPHRGDDWVCCCCYSFSQASTAPQIRPWVYKQHRSKQHARHKTKEQSKTSKKVFCSVPTFLFAIRNRLQTMSHCRLQPVSDKLENSCCNQVFVSLLSVKIKGAKSAIFPTPCKWMEPGFLSSDPFVKSSQAA